MSPKNPSSITVPSGHTATASDAAQLTPFLRTVPVARVRPEEGLGRQRDRAGHEELCRSIAQFGVLSPITVREAPDGSGDYLLIKGQGRTLACRLLGIEVIPALIVDSSFPEAAKVQQFLVENVARLRMRPIERALLIARARAKGEETAHVAHRFGISATTVRRLEAQLDGATPGEIAALSTGRLSIALHGVITRHVSSADRPGVIKALGGIGIKAKELDELFTAIGWSRLEKLGTSFQIQRLGLLKWCCATLVILPRGTPRTRIRQLADRLPQELPQTYREERKRCS